MTASRAEIQLQLPFEDPPARDDFPDAILNEVGVMVGNVIRRTYASAPIYGAYTNINY